MESGAGRLRVGEGGLAAGGLCGSGGGLSACAPLDTGADAPEEEGG